MFVFATRTCVARHGLGRVHVNKGEVWHRDDPFVKAHPDLFSDAPSVVKGSARHQRVEEATANPGSKRAKHVG